MAIKKISVSNFKSFENLDLELNNLNILIGANASGKSNFVKIFEFIRDVERYSLEDAITIQGGVKYLRNANIGHDCDLSFTVVSDSKAGFIRRKRKKIYGIKRVESIYEFAIKFNKKGLGFSISNDELTQNHDIFILERSKGEKLEEKEKLGTVKTTLLNDKGKIIFKSQIDKELPIQEDDFFPASIKQLTLPKKTLLISTPLPFIHTLNDIFENISIYDFDPRLGKKAVPIPGKLELEENGENLAIVLSKIIKNKENKKMLYNLIKDSLDFVDDIGIEKLGDKFLLFKLKEKYAENQFLPAFLLSDGTINITALIIALYFVENKQLIIIEEPERNIHPFLLSNVVEMLKDSSNDKQIIATTHNPQIVKYVPLENLLYISRDKNGFSKIERAAEIEDIKTFLKNEIGVEELFVKNLLGV